MFLVGVMDSTLDADSVPQLFDHRAGPATQRRKRRTVPEEDEDYYDLSGTGTSSDHHSGESEWEGHEWDGEDNDSDAADDMSVQLPTENVQNQSFPDETPAASSQENEDQLLSWIVIAIMVWQVFPLFFLHICVLCVCLCVFVCASKSSLYLVMGDMQPSPPHPSLKIY